MKVAELILALQALPPEAHVLVTDLINDDPVITGYAKVAEACIRYASSFELGAMDWDLTPTLEPWPEAEPVVLLKSIVFEETEYRGARREGPTWVYDPASADPTPEAPVVTYFGGICVTQMHDTGEVEVFRYRAPDTDT